MIRTSEQMIYDGLELDDMVDFLKIRKEPMLLANGGRLHYEGRFHSFAGWWYIVRIFTESISDI